MKKRPLLLTLLCILCFIEPLIKVLYFKATTHFDFMVIFANLSSRTGLQEIIDFWIIFPMAGVFLLKLRKWSYFSFLAVITYINYSMFTYEQYTWPYNSDSPYFYHYFIALFSIGVFVYFLHPATRLPFFDRRVRWWEPKTRYQVQLPCKIHSKNLTYATQILNISQSGAFIYESKYMKVSDHLELEFNFLGEIITVPVEVVSHHSVNGVQGYGVKFKFNSVKQSLLLRKVVRVLKHSQKEFKSDKFSQVST